MSAPLFVSVSAVESSPLCGALAVAELTTICAWCGAHLSGPRLVLVDGAAFEVSHGICAPCVRTVERDANLSGALR